jgi:ABC-2 type transport system permease protein
MKVFSEVRKYFANALIIAELEMRKIRHDQTQIWVRMVQPALWLAIYGLAMSKLNAMSANIPAGLTYLQFMTPGVLAQSALFVAIFFGINVVWERDLGLLNKLLSTPASRSSIILGKALSAGVRGIFQAIAVIILAVILQVHLILNPFTILGTFVVIILVSMCFSCVSMAIASLVKTRERMMGFGQVMTMPLFFASSAIYPISIMPSWIRPLAYVNPLTYSVDAMRDMLATGNLHSLPLDFAVIVATTVLFLVLASLGLKKMIS